MKCRALLALLLVACGHDAVEIGDDAPDAAPNATAPTGNVRPPTPMPAPTGDDAGQRPPVDPKCAAEVESNDTKATATKVLFATKTTGTVCGALSSATDVDYYVVPLQTDDAELKVQLTASDGISIEVTSPDGFASSASGDDSIDIADGAGDYVIKIRSRKGVTASYELAFDVVL